MTRKYFHKIVGIPIAITSLGVTIWLVNKWKIENQLLNASLSRQMPSVDEPQAPEPSVEPSEAPDQSPGTSSNEAQDVSQGQSDANKGEGGIAVKSEKKSEESDEEKSKESKEKIISEAKEDKVPDSEISNEEDSKTKETTQPETQSTITSKDSEGSVKSEKVEVDLHKEIKKLINRISQEGPKWITDIQSLRSVYYTHELFSVGKQLLQVLEKSKQSGQS